MQTILLGLDTRINNYASIDLMQGYNYTLEAHITDNYKDMDLTGVTVQLQMQKPDKKFIIQTENIAIEGNKIKATLDKDFTREDGQAKLQVVLLKDNFTFGSWVVKAKIKPSAINDNDGQSENKVTITEGLINKISEAENTKIELDKSIANGDVATIKGNVDKIKDVEIPKINEQWDNIANEFDEVVSNVTNGIESVTNTEIVLARKGKVTLKNKIDEVDNRLDLLENKKGKKYGVRFYKNSSNPKGERLGDAIGLTANVGVDNQLVVNDFDDVYPWGYRRVCNLEQDGTVKAYEGDPTFKRDGSNGDVMVETPIFYQKYVETDEYIEYWIADYFAPGFRLSPRFRTGSGEVLNKIYTGAYKASYVDSKLRSMSAQFPRVEAGRHTFRNWAKAKGSGWGLTDIAYRCDTLNYLFYIEFATLNSQTIMQGLTTFIWDYKTTAPTDNSNTLTLDSNNICVGFTLRVNDSDRRVVSVDSAAKTVVVDGEPFTVATDVTISSRAWINGETDNVKATSGSMLSNSDGKNCCKYRGEENPWGNIWEWVDGCNIKDWQAYTHWIPEEYADDKFVEPYTQLGYVQPQASGYVKRFGFDDNTPYAQLPAELNGSSSTYFCDYYYQSAGNKAPLVGANLTDGSNAGLVYWNCSAGCTASSRTFGARLSYKPS